MKYFEIATGYTSIPAKIGAATEKDVEGQTKSMLKMGYDVSIIDVKDLYRAETILPIEEVYLPQFFNSKKVVKLGIMHKVKRVLYSISLTFKLHRIIKHSKEQIYLHFHNQYNMYFFMKLTPKSLLENVKIGYTVHSYVWFGKYDEIKETIKRRYFQEVYCCKHADTVFVLNDVVTRMLIENYDIDSKKIKKIFNGVDTDVYDETLSTPNEILSLRKKYGLECSDIVFQVGSICNRKNQYKTLEMLIPLMKRNRNIGYAYAGGIIDIEYAKSIENLAKTAGVSDRVVYCGEISPGKDLNMHYCMSKVTVVNSTAEAYGLVITESLSASRPVFVNSSLINSINYWKENLGEGILEINVDFEDKLVKLLNDDNFYQMMQVKARKLAYDKLSWDAATRLHMQYM